MTRDPLTLRVAGNLRLLRRRRGLTQVHLASLTDLSPPYVSQLEMGRRSPTLTTIATLARALNVDPAQLLMLRPRTR